MQNFRAFSVFHKSHRLFFKHPMSGYPSLLPFLNQKTISNNYILLIIFIFQNFCNFVILNFTLVCLETENLYKAVLINAPIGFAHHKIVLDEDGKPIDYIFLDANPAFEELTGLSIEKIINKRLGEVAPEILKDKFDWVRFYGNIALNGGKYTFVQYSDALKRWYKVYAFSTEKFYFTTFSLDISDEYQKLLDFKEKEELAEKFYQDTQKLAEDLALSQSVLEDALYEKNLLLYEITEVKEKLEEALREKDKLFSIIAHDLKSPFSGFLGIANLLSTNIEDLSREELIEIAKMLKESAEKTYKLIENLLEWSRVQRGMIQFKPDWVNLFYLVNEISSLQAVNLQKKELQFLNEIPPELELFADMNMLSTIFRNLISNAIKFTPRGGKVIVFATKNADGETLIAVRDTGIGIPADMLPVLFKVGAKTFRPGTEGESSTGLGLVLCKEYVEKHGGKVWVESTEGSGTTFFFTIPNQTKE